MFCVPLKNLSLSDNTFEDPDAQRIVDINYKSGLEHIF